MFINPSIKKLFVLMLENRSYDNLFGWSDLRGWTPGGVPAHADGLLGKPVYSNLDASNRPHDVASGAPYRLDFDPGHEFSDVLVQLCGRNMQAGNWSVRNDGVSLGQDGAYPKMAESPGDLGFAYCLEAHGFDIASAMRCFSPEQLPVLNFLAHQFAVCDRWFSSMPGPTWPNRFFALAGTSWGLDYSPSDLRTVGSDFFDGEKFGNGSDSLLTRLAPEEWLVAHGDTPQSWSIKGVDANGRKDCFISHDSLLSRLAAGRLGEQVKFVFIEPRYDPLGGFREGESMHPTGDVRAGEALVRKVYEAIKASPYWDESILLVVFDEHGGFFDHAIPPLPGTLGAPPLAASHPTGLTRHNFRFDRYGVRVPAIVISPYVRQATIEHTFYDHLSIGKTLEEIVRRGGRAPLLATSRFEDAASFGKTLVLSKPRGRDDIPECPVPLPLPARSDGVLGTPAARAFAGLGWPP
ncbi:alkaline phosphatase family protein [Chromobacterium vaccinii]|uniref:Phospholipase n=1 Tax=Chromobacterium vaccinii TaxID=1108595 RepID=A0A1D9LEV8_9NEIS|nr:alkaline phosphatase family protein [Chromobacterium vaccinii]AOZ49770.1 phospholipase [Chromobacterium vaccinii]